MPTDDDNPLPRRVMMRGRRGGFAQGASTRSESLHTSAVTDEIDAAIDPEQVRDQIVREVRTRPMPRAALPPPPTRSGPADVPPDPRARMEEVSMAGSEAYSREYRLNILHRLLMRNVPLDQIARQLGVSVSTVEKDRASLKGRLREHARQLDINEIVGNQNALYSEISGMALRVADNADAPTPMRLAAMRTTLAAEADRTRFMNTAGVYDVLRFRKAEDGTDVSDVQALMSRTDEMLARLLESDNPTPPPARPPRITRRAPRAGGFAPMTMDDSNASGSDAETVEL